MRGGGGFFAGRNKAWSIGGAFLIAGGGGALKGNGALWGTILGGAIIAGCGAFFGYAFSGGAASSIGGAFLGAGITLSRSGTGGASARCSGCGRSATLTLGCIFRRSADLVTVASAFAAAVDE